MPHRFFNALVQSTMDQHRDYKKLIKEAVFNKETFARLTCSHKLGGDAPWVKVIVRPVAVKNRQMLQFSRFDEKRDITKNYNYEIASAELDELLSLPWGKLCLETLESETEVNISTSGKVKIKQTAREKPLATLDLTHDKVKNRALPVNKPDHFLQTIGVLDENGAVRPAMHNKYSQVNEFLRILKHVADKIEQADRPLQIVDCGCGSSHLTFAAYHYFNNVLGKAAEITGVDSNPELIGKCNGLKKELNWSGPDFVISDIAAFSPETSPDIVICLHACDSATDAAISKGIKWGAKAILAAPCCQHELHHKLSSDVFQSVLRHGILRERLSDILTDAFRASILRIMGYRTEVFEFISAEHTSKNIMIRAIAGARTTNCGALREYEALKSFWQVRPVLETMLQKEGFSFDANASEIKISP